MRGQWGPAQAEQREGQAWMREKLRRNVSRGAGCAVGHTRVVSSDSGQDNLRSRSLRCEQAEVAEDL